MYSAGMGSRTMVLLRWRNIGVVRGMISEKPKKHLGAKEGWRLSRIFFVADPVESRVYIVAYRSAVVPMR